MNHGDRPAIVALIVTTFKPDTGDRRTVMLSEGDFVLEGGSALVKELVLSPCPGSASSLETHVHVKHFDNTHQKILLTGESSVRCSSPK